MLRLLHNIQRHRYLIANFVARDLKVKYRGTVLGYFWSLLEPITIACTYWFLFVIIARRGADDFPLVIMLGLLPWTFFSSVVTGSANVLRANANLIRRVQIPRDVYVVASFATNLVVLLLNMLAVVPLLIFYHVAPGPLILVWVPAILMLGMISLGIGLVASCANVVFRDVTYLLSVALRIGMYLSAAVYPISMLPEKFRHLFLYNPIALSITMARDAFLDQPRTFGLKHALFAGIFSVAILTLGTVVFNRLEKKVVKYL